jgi:hypothetical protein
MKTANNKPWLSPHGQSLSMAKWVLEYKAPLLETDEYRNHVTMQMWVQKSQEIVDAHSADQHDNTVNK